MTAFDNGAYVVNNYDSVDSLSEIDGTAPTTNSHSNNKICKLIIESMTGAKPCRRQVSVGRSNVNRIPAALVLYDTNKSDASMPAIHHGSATLLSQASMITTLSSSTGTMTSAHSFGSSASKRSKQLHLHHHLQPLSFSAAIDLDSVKSPGVETPPDKRRGFGVFEDASSYKGKDTERDTHMELCNKSSSTCSQDMGIPMSPESCCADSMEDAEHYLPDEEAIVAELPVDVFTSQPMPDAFSRQLSSISNNSHNHDENNQYLQSRLSPHVKPHNVPTLFSADDFDALRHKESVAGLQSINKRSKPSSSDFLRFLCGRCCLCTPCSTVRCCGCCAPSTTKTMAS